MAEGSEARKTRTWSLAELQVELDFLRGRHAIWKNEPSQLSEIGQITRACRFANLRELGQKVLILL